MDANLLDALIYILYITWSNKGYIGAENFDRRRIKTIDVRSVAFQTRMNDFFLWNRRSSSAKSNSYLCVKVMSDKALAIDRNIALTTAAASFWLPPVPR